MICEQGHDEIESWQQNMGQIREKIKEEKSHRADTTSLVSNRKVSKNIRLKHEIAVFVGQKSLDVGI